MEPKDESEFVEIVRTLYKSDTSSTRRLNPYSFEIQIPGRTMPRSVLYCGDTSLTTAASYLAGMMSLWDWDFDYLASDQPLTPEALRSEHDLFIFSDYPSQRATPEAQVAILERVNAGAGLVMLGGWESFHGLGGNWDGTIIGELLPVTISQQDDRANCDHPVFVRALSIEHPIVADLPWNNRPPLIGGFNRVTEKPDASVLLEAVHAAARQTGPTYELTVTGTDPLLVVAQQGAGRTAAFMSDIAPHWIGPMVDWGSSRVSARARNSEAIEVGNLYAQFFHQLLEWARGA